MKNLSTPQLWFICGSQHLYGAKALEDVAANAQAIANGLNNSKSVALEVFFAGLVTTPEEIKSLLLRANTDTHCAGVILWMHTFSPAKMWIAGLTALQKPLCHLHTQFNRDLPWESIDMDFMNLNQAAHGDREAGFLHTRMRLRRKVVVGHWTDPNTQTGLNTFAKAAHAWHDLQGAKFARFGDNMRQVAVTEGDKLSAEMRFGFSVNGYGVGDLQEHMQAVSSQALNELLEVYTQEYAIAPELQKNSSKHHALRYEAQLELAIGEFLATNGYKGFTTTFEDLHGLEQLPGLAVQRLMQQGYGFGGEGDWKTAALLRAMKVMGGASFMEDYTYHLEPNNHLVLGAHMLEVCPSIAADKPSLEIHPLRIGGKSDPVRLVFNAKAGEALNASLVDMGNRFRLVVNQVKAIVPPELPKLPVARAVWSCLPDFQTACGAWIEAGGAHHTAYSYDVRSEILEDFANIAGIEFVLIDENTTLRQLRQDLRHNDLYYALFEGLKA
jgi:L-arabinose isomerase